MTNKKKQEQKTELKSLIVKANSIFDQFKNRGAYNQTYSTYDLYTALDYPLNITYDDYVQKYKRQDIANRIVKAPVQGTWRDDPIIYEAKDTDTPFEEEFSNLAVDTKLYFYLSKLDILSTLGRYAVLFLGLNDDTDPALPAAKAEGLSYVTPIPENRATIQTWEQDVSSPRYGLPLTYSITANMETNATVNRTVHWSRIIHVAENTLDSDVYGIPYLEPVYNRLLGLEKLSGGSPEMYWRGARPGYTAQSSDNTIITDSQLDHLQEQLSAFVNNMQRWLYVEGMEISSLAPQVVSPTDHVEVQLMLISAATRIPLRILTGSERGELASSQDERAWLSYLEERRAHTAENTILRPFIDRIISLGVIASPASGEYFIEWEPLLILSEKEKAEVANLKTTALKTYLESIGGSDIIPVETFLGMLGFSKEEIDLMLTIGTDTLKEEDVLREQ